MELRFKDFMRIRDMSSESQVIVIFTGAVTACTVTMAHCWWQLPTYRRDAESSSHKAAFHN
jgi:hypothetical protein